jgi:hypothetical protein
MKLINRIVIDIPRQIFNPLTSIKEKLEYYRELSKKGLSSLSDDEFALLHQDIKRFFNVQFAAFTTAEPTKLFRISFNKQITNQGRGGQLQKVSQLLGPPSDKAKLGRCNLHGESIFYCALDFNTAVWETKPVFDNVITISEWKIKDGKKIIINSIFNHPDITNVNQEAKAAYEGYLKEMDKIHPKQYELFDTIIKFATEEYVKPVLKDKPKEYLFSAQFSSSIFQPSPDGFRIEAIIYPSVQRKYGVSNLAILNSIILDRFELVSITTHDVIQTFYDKDPTSNESILGVFPAYKKITEFDIANDKIIYPDPLVELQKAIAQTRKQKNI